MTKDQPDAVILIHGTGAAYDVDRGNQWWLRGDPEEFPRVAWHRLDNRLAPHCVCLPEGELFHWPGTNSERIRHLSGLRLLERLLELERSGRSYHLVGHSHGGSVIWRALREAVRRRRGLWFFQWRSRRTFDLPGLTSWTTVGTPFLQISPALRRPKTILRSLQAYWIFLFWVLSIALVLEMSDVGSAALALMLTMFASMILFGLHIGGAAEACSERVSDEQAMTHFGSRWLGLYAIGDEAINGLAGTLPIKEEIIPPILIDWQGLCDALKFETAGKPVTSTVIRMSIVIDFFKELILSPFHNLIFAPAGNAFILNSLKRKAFGADRPGTRVTGVSAAPAEAVALGMPSLPDRIEGALREEADRNASFALSEMRYVLGRVTAIGNPAGALASLRGQLTWGALIHTSYFSHDGIIDLISIHVLRASGRRVPSRFDAGLIEWYETFREYVDRAARERAHEQSDRDGRFDLLGFLFILAASVSVAHAMTWLILAAFLLFTIFSGVTSVEALEVYLSRVEVFMRVAQFPLDRFSDVQPLISTRGIVKYAFNSILCGPIVAVAVGVSALLGWMLLGIVRGTLTFLLRWRRRGSGTSTSEAGGGGRPRMPGTP